MDDIYHKLVYDGKKCPFCFKYTRKDLENFKKFESGCADDVLKTEPKI